MTVGVMLSLNALALAALAPLSSLADIWRRLADLGANVDRITDVLTACPERDLFGTVLPPRLAGRIELRGVTFRHLGAAQPTLRNINAVIEPGQKVAIVGRTGCGKSTLARLLLGLYLPTEGETLYDGMPLRSLDVQSIRRQIGVVLQDDYIFNGSIRENISFVDPTMSSERVVAAATAAGLHGDIRAMRMGYETLVSEGGSALSGGQRQRLALARALAGAPPIILLDEATSHLDVTTERIIDENLKSLRCTRIIIAHRLSTVIDADLILLMDDGVLIEQGTHEALMRKGTHYRRLMADGGTRVDWSRGCRDRTCASRPEDA
jgi:ATP-binding cassette, subfamily B, bacterial